MSVEIRRGADRFADRGPGRMTWHAFSFGPHYDPERLAFGPMVCHDEHLLGEGQGFETHPHSGLEIVTWVLSGAVAHRDSTGTETATGTSTVLRPGSVGVLSAGSGVEHSEIAVAPATRFVQVWLTAENPDREPTYAVSEVSTESGALIEAARPLPGATLYVARLDTGQSLTLPAVPRLHAYVARGALLRSSLADPLQAGDAFLTEDSPELTVTAAVLTELLVWSFS